VPPYRVIVVDELTVPSGAVAVPSLFPDGERRFQIAGDLPHIRIAGVEGVTYSGGPSTQVLPRGRVWSWSASGWVESPLLAEGAGMAAEASLAMDLSADGVVVGAYAQPDAFGVWNWTAAVWRPTSSGLVRSTLAAPPVGCAPLDSIALGVGPGIAPAVVGAAHTRCEFLLEEPFVAMLAADPALGGTMTPLLGPSFECDFDQPVTSGVARAVVSPSAGSHLAIGHRYQFTGQQGCLSPLTPCDSTTIVEHNAHGWWLGGASFPELYIARLPGYRFSASDGQAQDRRRTPPQNSKAGPWLGDGCATQQAPPATTARPCSWATSPALPGTSPASETRREAHSSCTMRLWTVFRTTTCSCRLRGLHMHCGPIPH